MLNIPIQGMRDGQHSVELECRAEELQSSFDEFVGEVRVRGEIRKVGRRLHLDAVATCTARLTCDYTTKEFDEEIHAPFRCDFVLNTDLYNAQLTDPGDVDDEIVPVHEEEKFIDVTDIVRQELAVSLPLKRIAPEVRGASIEEFVDKRFLADTEQSDKEKAKGDDRWAALKSLSLPEDHAEDDGSNAGDT